jgi:hypothetical protein
MCRRRVNIARFGGITGHAVNHGMPPRGWGRTVTHVQLYTPRQSPKMALKPHDSFDTRWRNKQTTPFPPVSNSTSTASSTSFRWAGFRSSIWPPTWGTRVAIKEYLPNSLALRGEGEIKPVISEEHMPAFRYGMKCFFEEGRALAKLSHPNVIRVLNFFRANDTVYMVMEYEHGRTLQEFIQKNRAGVTENFMRNVFTKLLNGLREVHSHKLLHLDLKPSNIYMRNDYTPVLIDFRRRAADAGQRHADAQADVHAGLSPRRNTTASAKLLGPWSDIYSVGASMYACLAAAAPQAADSAQEKDRWCRPWCAGKGSTRTSCWKPSTGACASTTSTARKASSPCRRR